jgi:hypothetical protein
LLGLLQRIDLEQCIGMNRSVPGGSGRRHRHHPFVWIARLPQPEDCDE